MAVIRVEFDVVSYADGLETPLEFFKEEVRELFEQFGWTVLDDDEADTERWEGE
jgi:hypothetical protein|tara:strand:+ start:164 stop:325 length:162 start_codon:yes stop_codon:yes gene_type:complete